MSFFQFKIKKIYSIIPQIKVYGVDEYITLKGSFKETVSVISSAPPCKDGNALMEDIVVSPR